MTTPHAAPASPQAGSSGGGGATINRTRSVPRRNLGQGEGDGIVPIGFVGTARSLHNARSRRRRKDQCRSTMFDQAVFETVDVVNALAGYDTPQVGS